MHRQQFWKNSRRTVYRAVNFAMTQSYWNIGRVIVEEEQSGQDRAEYGQFLIKELSKRLTENFGKGFTKSNLYLYAAIFSHISKSPRTAWTN